MGARPAWSYTALTAFETCPRQYHLVRVTKTVKELPNDASLWGIRVHEALEARAREGTPLPEDLQYCEPYVQKILARPGEPIVEEQFCFNDRFQATDWFAEDAWCRGVVDIGVVDADRGWLFDWKTGRRKPDSEQLKLFAALAFLRYPALRKVYTGFIWLKERKLDRQVFSREQLPEIWNVFLPRVRRLELAYEQDKWPALPSGLCRKWCPVGRARCEFCGS